MAVMFGGSYSHFGDLMVLGFIFQPDLVYIEWIDVPWIKDLYEFSFVYCRRCW